MHERSAASAPTGPAVRGVPGVPAGCVVAPFSQLDADAAQA